MEKRKSMILEAIERLDQKMALGTSRHAAKQAQRDAGESVWGFSTERIHSHGTRCAYQEHVLHFLNWCRDQHRLTRLAQVDARADELACGYLQSRIAAGKRAYTVHSERAALRLFFENRELAQGVALPKRSREAITRSRRPAIRDQEFQPANWQREIQFLEHTGLRRAEARALRVEDVLLHPDGRISIQVRNGKGGKPRLVPVLAGGEAAIRACLEGCHDPASKVFMRLPSHLDIHALRRSYAQLLMDNSNYRGRKIILTSEIWPLEEREIRFKTRKERSMLTRRSFNHMSTCTETDTRGRGGTHLRISID